MATEMLFWILVVGRTVAFALSTSFVSAYVRVLTSISTTGYPKTADTIRGSVGTLYRNT